MTATDLTDPELGIVFVDTPDLAGPAASAHDAVALFQVESWRSVSTGVVSPLLRQVASPVLVRKGESLIQSNAAGGWGLDGTMRITISDVVVDGSTATALVCMDYSDVVFTNVDGSPPRSPAEVGAAQYERSSLRLSTLDDGATWRPEDGAFEGNTC